MSIYDIEVRLDDGTKYSLDRYKEKVMLIVNTATKCGFSPQFDELEALYKKYKKDGFVVLGFPSNQFHQEVASAEEAAANCRLTYGVTFPMHEVVNVNGKDAHPVFQYVTSHSKGFLGKSVKWNFTKFLVNQNGEIVQRFGSKDKPYSFEREILKYL
ncbi:glutathione peroxidase [Viridibacillus sp. FSL R5-0477]|uniref:Glutathione peroxidase n=1 Tax=Viridibacillus arenosi FSL R5-213 TaxID=1227360 RepID=W4F3S4_9BACL|nr:glutathione peroxidase [Viridibacillus arenosi]ETT87420.1 glutathione peroxidase bsaA-like protein [Viridibacillus arenosi FSL R5-213]OMC91310.1 glutathione peroxidase [Viridibacillus arenosi]